MNTTLVRSTLRHFAGSFWVRASWSDWLQDPWRSPVVVAAATVVAATVAAASVVAASVAAAWVVADLAGAEAVAWVVGTTEVEGMVTEDSGVLALAEWVWGTA